MTLTINAIMYLDDGKGYLTHYAPYYFVGPFLGAALAGLFHLLHKNALLEEPPRDVNERGFSQEVKEGLIENDHQQ